MPVEHSLEPMPADERARRIFDELLSRKAMPLLEIAAATGIRGAELKEAVRRLAAAKFVRLKGQDAANMIVSLETQNS